MSLLDTIRAGRAVFDWHPVDVERLRIWVMADALKVDGVRVAVSATEAQQAADELGAILPTPRIEDLIWLRAPVRIPAFPGSPVTRTAEQHSADIDRAIAGRSGLVATVGKSWVLTPALTPSRAANYGWHSQGARYPAQTIPGCHVWQPIGHAHNPHHRDYSQTCRLVRRRCLVDGREADLRDVLTDPVLARLVSHIGPLRVLRQPGVDEPPSQGPTDPTLPAIDLSQPLPLRALSACLAEAERWGTRSVTADRRDVYLAGCERNGAKIGPWLAQQDTATNRVSFCAAAQGWAEHEVSLPDEQPPPWRAGAREIERDAKEGRRGQWLSRERALDGEWPPAGALAVYWRKSEASGYGHVERVVEAGPAGYRSVGANEAGGKWFVDAEPVSYDHPRLLGFVVDDVPVHEQPAAPIHVPIVAVELVPLEVDWQEQRAARDSAVQED